MDDGLGLLSGERFVPQAELMERAARVASGLDEMGFRAGDCLAIMLRNEPAFLELSHAVSLLGGIPTPINWHWRGEEVGYLLADSRARALAVAGRPAMIRAARRQARLRAG